MCDLRSKEWWDWWEKPNLEQVSAHLVETGAKNVGHPAAPGCSPCYSPGQLFLERTKLSSGWHARQHLYALLIGTSTRTYVCIMCGSVCVAETNTELLIQDVKGDIEKPGPDLAAYLIGEQSSFTDSHPPQSCNIHRAHTEGLRDVIHLLFAPAVPV